MCVHGFVVPSQKPSGVEALEVTGFKGGWLEFSIKYPRKNQNYKRIEVDDNRALQSFNQWESISNLLLYHDIENKELKVSIKDLQSTTKQNHEIEFYPDKGEKKEIEVDVKIGKILLL